MQNNRKTYTGTVPGANETVTLYETGEAEENLSGQKWWVGALYLSNDGTLEAYYLNADGTERKFGSQAVTGGTGSAVMAHFYLEPFARVIIKFVNGATPQDPFEVEQALSNQRARAVDDA